MIGGRFPEWQRLAKALGELASETGASNAYVLDSVANLWCAGERYDGPEADKVMELAYEHLTKMPRPLNRGGRVDGAVGQTYLRSFAGIYVLALQFKEAFDLAFVRALTARALPKIEALTLSLPPPEGPGSGSAEGLGSA